VDVAQARGASPAGVALAWLLDRPGHQAKTASDRLGPADLSLLGPYLAM
jgi:hypothetical protein